MLERDPEYQKSKKFVTPDFPGDRASKSTDLTKILISVSQIRRRLEIKDKPKEVPKEVGKKDTTAKKNVQFAAHESSVAVLKDNDQAPSP